MLKSKGKEKEKICKIMSFTLYKFDVNTNQKEESNEQ